MQSRLIDPEYDETPGNPSAQSDLFTKLLNMGFDRDLIQISMSYTGSRNINELLSFMTPGEEGWKHDFIRKFHLANESYFCEICKDREENHAKNLSFSYLNSPGIYEEAKSSNSGNSSIYTPYNNLEPFPELCEICLFSISAPHSISTCEVHKFCLSCIRQYLEILISDSKVLDIKCPGLKCSKEFTDFDVENIVSASFYSKYLKFKARSELLKDPLVRWCPKPDCEGFIKGKEGDSIIECPVCSTQICFKCGKSWHDKQSCEELVDLDYEKWAKGREIQLCPKCHHKIEKVDGCNHMTCAACRYNWCWLCRGKYSYNHFSSFNPFGCPNLQSGFNTREAWPMWKIYCARLTRLMIWLLIIIGFPIILLFGPAVYSFVALRRHYYYKGKYFLAFNGVFLFIFVTCLTPIGYAFGLPLFLVYLCVKWVKRSSN